MMDNQASTTILQMTSRAVVTGTRSSIKQRMKSQNLWGLRDMDFYDLAIV